MDIYIYHLLNYFRKTTPRGPPPLPCTNLAMLSQEKLAANRLNATLSTGPRTPEGKAASSLNSQTHGLNSKTCVVLPGEEAEFDQFKAAHQNDVKPIGALEDDLFLQLLSAAWNLRRVRIRESALVSGDLDPLANSDCAPQLLLLERYRRANERTFHLALKELRTLQTDRLARDIAMRQKFSEAFPRLVNPNRIRHKISPDGNIVLGRKLLMYNEKQFQRNEPTVPAGDPQPAPPNEDNQPERT